MVTHGYINPLDDHDHEDVEVLMDLDSANRRLNPEGWQRLPHSAHQILSLFVVTSVMLRRVCVSLASSMEKYTALFSWGGG